MKRHCLLLIIPALLLCAATAWATPNLLIPYQKSAPTLAGTGPIYFNFTLWTSDIGGSPVWTENKQVIVNATKVISTKLGDVATLANVDFSQQLWVEVTNNAGNIAYGTRDKLVIGPYAFWSKSVANGAITGSSLASMDAASGQVPGYNGTTWAPVNAGGSGTVTSVGLDLPLAIFTVSNAPVTTTGNLTGTFKGQTQGTVFAGPASGVGTPTFRALVAADIPTLNQSTTGTAANVTGIVALANGGTGAATQAGAANAVLPSQSGKTGYLLKTNGASVGWVPGDAVKSPVTGNLTSTSNTIIYDEQYTGSTITLPPGKWNVQLNMMLSGTSTCNAWVRSTFSDNDASATWSGPPPSDIVGSALASGLNIQGNYGNVIGSIIINNTSGVNKTYYYWATQPSLNLPCTYQLINFGTSLWGENQMIAFPMTQ